MILPRCVAQGRKILVPCRPIRKTKCLALSVMVVRWSKLSLVLLMNGFCWDKQTICNALKVNYAYVSCASGPFVLRLLYPVRSMTCFSQCPLLLHNHCWIVDKKLSVSCTTRNVFTFCIQMTSSWLPRSSTRSYAQLSGYKNMINIAPESNKAISLDIDVCARADGIGQIAINTPVWMQSDRVKLKTRADIKAKSRPRYLTSKRPSADIEMCLEDKSSHMPIVIILSVAPTNQDERHGLDNKRYELDQMIYIKRDGPIKACNRPPTKWMAVTKA